MTPALSVYGHYAKPPLTPVRQIISTLLHLPQIEYHRLRTLSGGDQTSAGIL